MSESSEVSIESESERVQVVECGVDWLTVTGKTQGSWERVSGMAMSLLYDEQQDGGKTWRSGRNGYRLLCCKGLQFGQGPNGWMVCLSGATARRYWMSFYAYSANCTRVDLQVTVRYPHYDGREVDGLYRGSRDQIERAKMQSTYLRNSQGGATLYIGARKSERMGRIYDKHEESLKTGEYRQCVRFEVEYKGRAASAAGVWLLSQVEHFEERVASHVLDWFADRYVEVPSFLLVRAGAFSIGRRESSSEKRLRWLKKTVAPVYRQLKMAGLQTEADEAIGVLEDIDILKGD